VIEAYLGRGSAGQAGAAAGSAAGR